MHALVLWSRLKGVAEEMRAGGLCRFPLITGGLGGAWGPGPE